MGNDHSRTCTGGENPLVKELQEEVDAAGKILASKDSTLAEKQVCGALTTVLP